jgi:excisionase family DNA binding protein
MHQRPQQRPDQLQQADSLAAPRAKQGLRQGLRQGLWKDFARTPVHDHRVDVFTAVTAHWLTAAEGTRGRTAIESWAQRRPSLAAYHSPAELVAAINQSGQPERSCALLADLLLVAENDPLAQLAVLRALIPGLRRAVHQRWKTAATSGPWRSEADLATDAISIAWEAIGRHAGRTHPLPARLIIRQVERRLRTLHDANRRDTKHAAPVADVQSLIGSSVERPEVEERRFAHELLQAVYSGDLDPASAAIAYRIGVFGEPIGEAGRGQRLDPGQTRESLRLVLEVLAGATRAPTTTDGSRQAIHAPTKEASLVPTVPHPPDHHAAPTPAIMPLLLTVNQAAQMLGIGRSTLYELIENGEIRSVKVGASRRVPLKAVHEYIDRLLGDDEGAAVGDLPNLTVAHKS